MSHLGIWLIYRHYGQLCDKAQLQRRARGGGRVVLSYISLQFRQLMSRPKVFPFYKHLVEQECRKDIIFENDFTNKRTQAANAPFFNKYKEMFMKNKMRLAYLAGFSAIFSLGYLYDVLFQSSFYTGLVDQTERLLMKIEGDNRQSRVDYRDRVAAELGRYFIRLEQLNLNRQITPAALSTRSPAFLQCQTEVFDVDSFVSFCLKHKVALEELPNPSRL